MRFGRHLAQGVAAGLVLAVTSPALEWKTKSVTVTTIPFQSTVDTGFEFRNGSDKPVAIRVLETDCDCLEAATDLKVYPPGADGSVRARFTVGDRFGLYERTITVVTDEPDSPVRLRLQIEVSALASFAPRSVAWQLNETPTEKSLDLRPAPGLEIVFAETVATSEAFAARLEAVEPGRLYRLHLRPRDTKRPASAAIRVFGHEKAGHEVVVSAYASVP